MVTGAPSTLQGSRTRAGPGSQDATSGRGCRPYGAREVNLVPPDKGHELVDQPLEQEIALLGELMAAAAEVTDHLDESRIDEVLDDRSRACEP